MLHFVSAAEACDWLKKPGGRGITSWYIITSLTSAYQGGQAPSPSSISQLHVLQCLGDFFSISLSPRPHLSTLEDVASLKFSNPYGLLEMTAFSVSNGEY